MEHRGHFAKEGKNKAWRSGRGIFGEKQQQHEIENKGGKTREKSKIKEYATVRKKGE